MSERAPNEKLIEMLFTHYALRCLADTGVTVYAPSTREEFVQGYDTRLMNASGFDELYLQFKTPHLLKDDRYSFGTTAHQHRRLRCYPLNSAYYVTHTFRCVKDIQEAQRASPRPEDFLQKYVAIEVGRLEEDVRFFRYGLVDGEPDNVAYRCDRDGSIRKTPRKVKHHSGWMTGDELLRRFGSGEAGTRIVLSDTNDSRPNHVGSLSPRVAGAVLVVSREDAERMVQEETDASLGTAFRTRFQPL